MSTPFFQVGEKGIKSDKSELLSLQSLFDFDRKMASCITKKFKKYCSHSPTLPGNDWNNILHQ